MNANFLLESVFNLKEEMAKMAADNRAVSDRNHSNDIRTLALLKAIVGEIVLAEPDAKARMNKRLDKLLLLHRDDDVFCTGIKEAARVVAVA